MRAKKVSAITIWKATCKSLYACICFDCIGFFAKKNLCVMYLNMRDHAVGVTGKN